MNTSPEEALAFIHGLERFGSRLGLARVRRLLAELGDPHLGLRVIHVAGTNGKGSVAAMLASVLTAAGHRTGLYISPYIAQFGERIQVDGRNIAPEAIAELVFGRLVPALRRMERGGDGGGPAGEVPFEQTGPVTEFEFVTALGLCHFARERVDFLVFEVGLGGRFDATNVVDRPLLSVITPIGLDHTDRLGPTVRAIAAEKAGIIKRAAPVVSARQEPEALWVLKAAARRRGAPFYLAGRDGRVTRRSFSLAGQVVDYEGVGFGRVEDLELPLLGPHQLDNAATALTALGVLRERGWVGSLDERALREGLRRTAWPGRFEVFGRRPAVVVDGAHNPHGARALAAALRELLPGRRLALVLGILGDKDVEAFLEEVLPPAVPGVEMLLCCRPASPRARPPEELARRAAGLRPGLKVEVCPEVGRAVRRAATLAGPDGAVVVAGSLYQVAEARAAAAEVASAEDAESVRSTAP